MVRIMKLHELFRKVQHPQLQDMVKAIEVRDDLDGITYSETANHLTSAFLQDARISIFPKGFRNLGLWRQ